MGNLIWRQAKVEDETGLSRSTIWRLMKAGEFPQKIQLGPRATGWRSEEILQWCRDRGEAKNIPIGKHKGLSGRVNSEVRQEGMAGAGDEA